MKQRHLRLTFLLLLPLGLGWWLWPRSHPTPAPQALSDPPPSINFSALSPAKGPAPVQSTSPALMEHQPTKKSSRPSPTQARALLPEEIAQARSEIKVSLSAIYLAQKSFHAEYGRYSTDLHHGLGYMPEGEPRWSKMGFLQPHSPRELTSAEDPRYMDTDAYTTDTGIAPEQRFTYRNQGQDLSLTDLSAHCRQGCTADQNGFEAIAAVTLVPGQAPEVWLINEKKEILQVQDGLTGTKPTAAN